MRAESTTVLAAIQQTWLRCLHASDDQIACFWSCSAEPGMLDEFTEHARLVHDIDGAFRWDGQWLISDQRQDSERPRVA